MPLWHISVPFGPMVTVSGRSRKRLMNSMPLGWIFQSFSIDDHAQKPRIMRSMSCLSAGHAQVSGVARELWARIMVLSLNRPRSKPWQISVEASEGSVMKKMKMRGSKTMAWSIIDEKSVMPGANCAASRISTPSCSDTERNSEYVSDPRESDDTNTTTRRQSKASLTMWAMAVPWYESAGHTRRWVG